MAPASSVRNKDMETWPSSQSPSDAPSVLKAWTPCSPTLVSLQGRSLWTLGAASHPLSTLVPQDRKKCKRGRILGKGG